MDQLVHIAAQHLLLLVSEHLRRCRVDDGYLTFQIDTVDAIANRLKNRIRLPRERA